MEVEFEIVTEVSALLFVNVAVPLGTELGDQLLASVHSPLVVPTHVASCACADSAAKHVPANKTARVLPTRERIMAFPSFAGQRRRACFSDQGTLAIIPSGSRADQQSRLNIG